MLIEYSTALRSQNCLSADNNNSMFTLFRHKVNSSSCWASQILNIALLSQSKFAAQSYRNKHHFRMKDEFHFIQATNLWICICGYVHVVKISSSWTAKCNWQCTLQRSNICNINLYKNKQEFLHRTLYSSYLPPEIAKCNLHRTVQRSLIRNIKLYNWNKQKLLVRPLLYSLVSLCNKQLFSHLDHKGFMLIVYSIPRATKRYRKHVNISQL